MAQTAVEFLKEQYDKCPESFLTDDDFNKAKEIEKQQIIDAYSEGWHDGQDLIIDEIKHIDAGGDDAGKKFYNQTFAE
jgi:hypothetical protein